MPYSNIKWITFDVGGTLLFPNPSVGTIYAEVLSRHGHDGEAAQLEESFMRVWKKEVLRCMPSVSAESERERWRGVLDRTFSDWASAVDMDALFEDLWGTFCDAGRWRFPQHTEETLAELRKRGYRLAVLSNWDDRLRPLLKGIGLDDHFEEIFVSCEIGFEKPDARLFAAVEERLGTKAGEILHIGDSHHHDVAGANARGWPVVQVFCEASMEPACRRIDCFTELLGFLPGPSKSSPG